MDERWYLCITQPNRESDACWHLRRQGYATFYPRRWQRYHRDRVTSMQLRPLFPGYLFVAIIDNERQSVGQICDTIGVAMVLHKNGEAYELPERIVADMRQDLGEDGVCEPEDELAEHLYSMIDGLGAEVASVLLAAFGRVRSVDVDKPRQRRNRRTRRQQRRRTIDLVGEPAWAAA